MNKEQQIIFWSEIYHLERSQKKRGANEFWFKLQFKKVELFSGEWYKYDDEIKDRRFRLKQKGRLSFG